MRRYVFLLGIVGAVVGLFGTALTPQAHADSIAYTTIPDSSGLVTCNGQNADGTTGSWTAGGNYSYTKRTNMYYLPGCYDIISSAGDCCTININISSNMKAGASTIEGDAFMAYVQNGQNQTAPIGSYSVPAADQVPGMGITFNKQFGTLSDITNCQYKVDSAQYGLPSTWTAATPYL